MLVGERSRAGKPRLDETGGRRPGDHRRHRTADPTPLKTAAAKPLRTLAGLVPLFLIGSARAEDATTAPTRLDAVVVTATRTEERGFDVPASVDVVGGTELHEDRPGISPSDGLRTIPGVTARDRQNYAQDLQVSIRGFGARATFGLRGLRVFVDGIPATMPDGQGQTSHIDLASAGRIEVLRGPFSALYGNSSGGVIQVFTEEGSEPPELRAGLFVGSYGTVRGSAGALGRAGPLDYHVDATHFSTDGFRDHGAARRDYGNARLGWKLAGGGSLAVVIDTLSAQEAQDPLGLTRAQADADPRQATGVATQFNTRKSVEQTQAGLVYEQPLGATQAIRLAGYAGARQVRQYLAIPVSAQAAPGSAGGVVDLQGDYAGIDGRWIWRGDLMERPFSLVAGLDYERLDQRRRGYENFVGTTLGVQGALRRDEDNSVHNLDEYLQGSWRFAPDWSLQAGLRHSQVDFDSADHYITTGNGDGSGGKVFVATSPVAGLLWRPGERLRVYATYGEGFETPSSDELAYRPDGGSGLNFGLQPARSGNGELGLKLRLRESIEATVAVFRSITRNELVVATNSGGRATYQNAGRTRRQGIEAGLDAALGGRWHGALAYTYLDARVRESYLSCTSTPCTTPTTTIAAGNRLPGVAASNLYAALCWGDEAGWRAALEAQAVGAVPVNDANRESAPAYGLLGFSGGYTWPLPHWRLRGFGRIDNLGDNHYIGSVIVNDGNGRYYEPGPGRSAYVGLDLAWKPY